MKRIYNYAVIALILLQGAAAHANGGWGLWGMGYNANGQRGSGNVAQANLPTVSVASNVVTQLASGEEFTMFIETGGSLWGAGIDYYGQLGDTNNGANVNALTPEMIVPSGVAEVAAGYYHTMFVKSDGSLWGMGTDSSGQLGDGTYGNPAANYSTNIPEMVQPSNVVHVAAGYRHTLFTKTDGSLWSMGDNQVGELGINQTSAQTPYTNTPQMVFSNGVTAIAAGGYHSLFILADSSLWGIGANGYGDLGIGTSNNNYKVPVKIWPTNVIAAAAGLNHCLFITSDGTLWAMGQNQYGQLGSGTTNNSATPLAIATNVAFAAAGDYNSAFVQNDGSLWTMGDNTYDQLGNGTNIASLVPIKVVSSNVVAVGVAEYTTMFLATVVLPPAQIRVSESNTFIANAQTNVINLGTALTNQAGPIVIFSVTNSGGQALGISGLSVPAGYTLASNLPGSIAAAGHATFAVQLTATSVGTYPGNIIVTNSDATNGTFSFPVTGAVISPASIQLATGTNVLASGQTNVVAFGSVALNQTGPIVAFNVTNNGGQTLDLNGIALPTGYALVSNFPPTIAAGSNGTFSIQLNGSAPVGTYAGFVTVSNNSASHGLFTFPITGTVVGKVIVLSGNLQFGVEDVGATNQLTLTISNAGNALLTVSNITGPAGFSVSLTNAAIAAAATQAVTVSFSPTAAGLFGGNITVISDATSGVNTIPASGFGANDSLVLTLITNGPGKITPNLLGKPLKANVKYTLTATPSNGNVFSNWTGSIVTNKNPLTFVMQSNLVLAANFVTNPFLVLKGSYNGLFYPTNGVTEDTSGMLKALAVTTKGTYSGALVIGGVPHGINGTFGLDGAATNTIKRTAAQGGNLTVVMNLSGGTFPQVTGRVTGTNWIAPLLGDFATNLVPAGEYTMLIPPDTNNTPPGGSPGGDGYATVTNLAGTPKNAASASAKITGALADGTAFNQSVPVSHDGYVPVYATLYANKGLLLGWINLDLTNTTGTGLTWIHPTTKTGLYKGGFTNIVLTNQILLSSWTNPSANLALLTNITLLDVIGSTHKLTNVNVSISSSGKVTGTGVTGTLNVKTGLLKVTIGDGPKKISVTGAVLLNSTNSGGYYLTETNAQAFIIGQ